MKKILFSLGLSILFSSSYTIAQQNPLEIKLKIANRSGLFGMSGPKIIRITLSTKNREKALTCENVNSGNYYYFLIQNEGRWQIDADFLNDDLPKLTLIQEETKLHSEFTGDIIANAESTVVLVGFRKTLALHKPFSFEYPSGETISKVEMNIPQEYWPGYSKVTKYLDAGDKASKEQQYKAAVLNFNTILSDKSLAIFPSYSTAKEKRLEAFDKYFTENYGAFSRSMGSDGDLKQKIAATGESIAMFQYVVDSLADQSAGVSASDETIVPLMERAKNAFQRSHLMLDSLHQSLEDFNVRWIIAGSSAGRIDFKYKYMIEALAYAFTSVNFADSTAKDLTVVLPEDLSARLKKYNLIESYETFVKIVTARWKKKSALFPPGFLSNLVKDSLQFPLPYYSVLKATNDFFSSNYDETKKEIFQVMKKSYDHELTGRMDDLRVIIDTREKKIPGEVLAHMRDGQLLEEKGNTDGAAEHYKDATLISEEYAPAAFALGKLYDRIGDSYKANNFFQKAVTSDTIYYSAYRFLYINYFKNSNFKPMIDLLTQALARGNDFFDIHYYLGIAYNGAALYEEAIKQYERALELNSKSIDANIQAGIAYQNMKSYAKAREYYTRAIQIDPENQTATENLKRLDELQKKF
jgi:tetratricopeptide (TPR) repeat protein